MTTGSAGYFNDFITRDALQSMLGIVANDPPEAIYPIAHTDADGIKFNGANRYTMRFEPGKLPGGAVLLVPHTVRPEQQLGK